ncbi:MAG: protein kinase, partial [Chloroflexi bacterium]|nr:protein kinase [Chloroflexota bacterium]
MSEPLIGTQIDNYYIEARLGNEENLYIGRDRQLDRTVVVRIIPHPAPPGLINRARQLANLRHTNINHLYYFAEREAFSFLVLQHIRGADLVTLLARRKAAYPAQEAGQILAPLSEALVYAHGVGVTHGSIQSSSVMIEADTGRPVLVDFGLEPVPPAEDVYQFARLVYGMLTGRASPPQVFDPVDATSLSTPLAALLHRALAPISPVSRKPFQDIAEFQASLLPALEDSHAAVGSGTIVRHPHEGDHPTQYTPPPSYAHLNAPETKQLPWLWLAGGGILVLVAIGALVMVALMMLGN